MAYVSYLYMEKAYRSSTEPTPIPVSTNILTVECGIQVSVEDFNQSEQVDWLDTYDTMSISTTSFGESGQEDCSRSSTPIQTEAFDDRLSIASSVPSIIQKTKTIETPKQIMHMSGVIQIPNPNIQKFSANSSSTKKKDKQISPFVVQRDQYYPKTRVNEVSTLHEGQRLISSTPVDSEDEDNLPNSPEKNSKKKTPKSRNKPRSTAV